MKNMRGFLSGLGLCLAIAISTVGIAQTTKPADQTPKAESCCASCCCCQGDSCAMHGQMEHAQGMKHADALKQAGGQMKTHSPEGGCCCSGDSCEMQLKKQEQAKEKQE